MAAAPGIQAGFGDALGAPTLDALRALGITIVRIDLQQCNQVKTTELAQEVLDKGLQPLCIIRRSEQMSVIPEGGLIELGNEPDIAKFGFPLSEYKTEAAECVSIALVSGQRLYLGAVSNLNQRGFDFLNALPWASYPAQICCSAHRYPEGKSPTTPHAGSTSRENEVAKLRAIVGARPMACTEVGYYDSAGGWSEADVAKHMAWERKFFSDQGFEIVVGFQLNDGAATNPDKEAHYGFRRLPSLEWKPVASAFVRALEGL